MPCLNIIYPLDKTFHPREDSWSIAAKFVTINCSIIQLYNLTYFAIIQMYRGILVELVLCVLLGHPNSKIANSMKLVTFAFFSSQYHVFELKNIRGNLIAPNSNRWSLSNENAMSQEDNRKIISLFGQEKSIFLHP